MAGLRDDKTHLHDQIDEFQQFVETQLDGGGSTLKTEIETAIKTAVGNQLKRGKDGRSMSHYVSDSIEEAKSTIQQGDKLRRLAANDIEEQTKQLGQLDRGYIADAAVAATDAIRSAVQSVADVLEPGAAGLMGQETKEARLAYAAEKAVLPLRDLANAASTSDLAGQSEGTQNSVGGRLEAAKAVRDEQTAQLRAKTGDVLYPAAGKEEGVQRQQGENAQAGEQLDGEPVVKPRPKGGEFSAGQLDANVPLTR